MMRTPEPEGEPNLRQDTSASGSQVTEGGGPTGGDVSANTRPSDSVVGFARPGAHSNELIYARRLASKHKLQPYQREAVDEFTKVCFLVRITIHYLFSHALVHRTQL